MSESGKVFHLDWGRIVVWPNEVSIISHVEDPPKIRMSAEAGGSLGCFSFGRCRPGTNIEDEVVLVQGKIDERFRLPAEGGTGNRSELVGELRVDLARPARAGDTDDGRMIPILQLHYDKIVAHVPIVGAPVQSRVTRFYTDHGEFCVNWQDDGDGPPRGIVYDTHGSADETSWTAVGEMRISPLMAV